MRADAILTVLDACCDAFRFPMLDNGYVYLAATRLCLFRSPADWALVIEVFGYSPRAGIPDTHIYTFASRLRDRDTADNYRSEEAYQNYLASNPHNESRFIHPVDQGAWLDPEDCELVAIDAATVGLRGRAIELPTRDAYARLGIDLTDPDRVRIFELCRHLAAVERDAVLATGEERRVSVPTQLDEIMMLDEWYHPNVVDDAERPSGSPTFQELARVLETGDVAAYRPTLPANTHWSHWPEGGTL